MRVPCLLSGFAVGGKLGALTNLLFLWLSENRLTRCVPRALTELPDLNIWTGVFGLPDCSHEPAGSRQQVSPPHPHLREDAAPSKGRLERNP